MKKAGIMVALVAATLLGGFCHGGYTRLSYLDCNRESANADGNGSWVRLTGYVPQCTERFLITFSDRANFTGGKFQCFFCARTSGDSITAFQAWNANTTWNVRFDFKNATPTHQVNTTRDGNVHTVEWAGLDTTGKAYGYIDGVKSTAAIGTASFTPGDEMVLFASHSGTTGYGHAANFRFYDLVVRNQGMQIVHHFVPARDDSATAGAIAQYGVYDTVTDTFYPNTGNRVFLANGATDCGTLGVQPTRPARQVTAGELVENGGVKTMPLAFDNPGYPQRLFMAWGNADGGDTTNTWEHVEALPEVGADETARNVTLPAAAKKVRFFIYPAIPGATAVASLNSTGNNEFIDTGFMPNHQTRADATFEVDSGSTFKNNYCAPFGARIDQMTQFFPLAIVRSGDGFPANSWRGRWYNVDFGFAVGKPGVYGSHEISLNRNTYIIDGYTNIFASAVAFSSGRNLYAFGINNNNSLAFSIPMKLRTLDVWDDDMLVRSYIPCVKDDGTPALYDAVNETFAVNGGATPLTTGPVAMSCTPTLQASTDAAAVAWWTGNGDGVSIDDSANWACTNSSNAEVTGALPDDTTVISIGDFTLTRDLDFSALPSTLQIAGTVDLAGHTLKLTHFEGEGTITDTTGYTTFAEAVTHGIESVLTDYVPVSTDRIEAEMLFQRNDGTHGLWCARGLADTAFDTMTAFIHYQGFRFDYDYYVDPAHCFRSPLTPSRTEWHTLVMDGLNHRAYDNGVEVANFGYGEFTCGGPLMIFASYSVTTENIANRCNEVFMRRFQIFAPDNSLKFNLVPRMRNADGQLGLYDLVGDKFYPAVGAFDFRRPVANDATGTLVIDVPEGLSITNNTVAFMGGLKLIKRGAGTFTAAKRGQRFTGGAIIEAGTAMSAKSPDEDVNYYTEFQTLWGERVCLLQIESGATFDTQGNYEFYLKNVVLNGGTLANTGRIMANRDAGAFGSISLTAPSRMYLPYHTTLTRENFVFDLGGHELQMDLGTTTTAAMFGKPSQGIVTNGTIVIDAEGASAQGRMLSFKANVDMRTVNIHQKDAQIQIDNNLVVKVGDYLTECTTHAARSVVPLEVYGTFTPKSQIFYGVVMADGSRIDLRDKAAAWSTQTACPEQPSNKCTFMDGATVTIDISGRTPAAGEQIIAWDAKPNAAFVWDATTAAGGVTPVALDDGLYYGVPTGSGMTKVGPCSLDADLDLSDGAAYLDGTIDLNGHNLTLANFTGVANIVDTSANPGKVTLVCAGTFKASAIDRTVDFGEGVIREIVVPTGVVLDLDGTGVPAGWTVVMAGGEVTNTGAKIYGGIPAMRLTLDSSISVTTNLIFGVAADSNAAGQAEEALVDLGGHTLTVDIAGLNTYFLLYNVLVTNGTVRTTNDGFFSLRGDTPRFREATLELDSALEASVNSEIDVLIDNSTRGVGDGRVDVCGRFVPNSPYYRWIQVKNGATLDLRDKDTAWTVSGTQSIGLTHNVYFEPHGFVTVDCAGRTLAIGDKLVDWSGNAPKPVNVSFTLDAASAAALPGVALEARNDGLYIIAAPAARRIVIDPIGEGALYSANVPRFAAGDRLALAAKYADATSGRYLLATWDAGDFDLTNLATLFDATSASGTNPALVVTKVGEGGELWLELDHGAERPRLNVLVMGDATAITDDHCLRFQLLKTFAANGYDVMAKGIWNLSNTDQNGSKMPYYWSRHSAMADIKLRTTPAGYGALDNVAALLDQASDVDVVVLQYTDDDAEALAALVAQVNAIRPHAKVFTSLASESDVAAIAAAVKADTAFTPGYVAAKSTTTGVVANVPAAEREGFSLARVYDIAANDGLPVTARPVYEDYGENPGVVSNIGRVAYYIEFKRKNDAVTDYGGEVRWVWAAVDAFNNRAIDEVGIPARSNERYAPARHLRVLSNMPGIASTPVGEYDQGSLVFQSGTETAAHSGNPYAAEHVYGHDWNNEFGTNTRGMMLLSRFTPNSPNPAETIFSYERWKIDCNDKGGHHELGFGNFAMPSASSLNWVGVGQTDYGLGDTMSVGAYEMARIEIWTMPESAIAEQTARAVWTGAANDGVFTNPQNWTCYNAMSNTIANALPDAQTSVEFTGTVNLGGSLANAFPHADIRFTGVAVLTDDLDLRGTGNVIVEGEVDLMGYRLSVDGLSGAGTVANGMSFDLTDPTATSRMFSRWPQQYRGNGGALGLTSPANLFNDDRSHTDAGRVLYSVADINNGKPLDIGYDFGEPTVVDCYRVWFGAGQNNFARAPSNWTLEGSNDGTNYTVLDTRERIVWMQDTNNAYKLDEGRVFTCGNTTAYRYYRMVFTKPHSDATWLEFTEIEFGRQNRAGTLYVDVAEGKTYDNGSVKFDGNIRLVKAGAGTLLARRTGQTNIFNEIEEGTLAVDVSGLNCPIGQNGAIITVHEDGVFDFNGHGIFTNYGFILDGGKLVNSGNEVGSGTPGMNLLYLTADSTIDIASSCGLDNSSFGATTIVLGGHTLTVRTGEGATMYLFNADILPGGSGGGGTPPLPGTIKVEGRVDVDKTGLRAEGVRFEVPGLLKSAVPGTVGDYLVSGEPAMTGNGTLTVKGVFKPVTDCFLPTLLANGATLDLRGRSEILDLTTTDNAVTYAQNATINVALDGRTPRVNGKLVGWDENTAPGEGVTFKLAPGVNMMGKLQRKADGLYWDTGLVIFIR